MSLKKVIKLLMAFSLIAASLPINSIVFAEENGRDAPRQGLPGRRIGGGSRNPQAGCLTDANSLTALIPETNLGLTASANPAWLFYIPAGHGSRTVEFVLRNSTDELVYEEFFEVPAEADLHRYQPSQTALSKAIEPETNYKWYLSVICDAENRAEDVVVEGWLRRVELSEAVLTQLRDMTPLEQIALYQERGIWHEAVAELYRLLEANPSQSLANQWLQMLQAENLDDVGYDILASLQPQLGVSRLSLSHPVQTHQSAVSEQ